MLGQKEERIFLRWYIVAQMLCSEEGTLLKNYEAVIGKTV